MAAFGKRLVATAISMRSMVKRFRAAEAFAVLMAVVFIGASTSAQALPITWTLQNVLFDDGTQVTGEFTINEYGFFGHPPYYPPVDISTVDGDILGFHYTDSTPNFIFPAKLFVEFSHDDYHGYLALEFQNPLTTENLAFNPIVSGQFSYECNGYEHYDPPAGAEGQGYCPEGAGIRHINGGGVANEEIAAPVPEPATLALLGLGLAGLGFSRRKQ